MILVRWATKKSNLLEVVSTVSHYQSKDRSGGGVGIHGIRATLVLLQSQKRPEALPNESKRCWEWRMIGSSMIDEVSIVCKESLDLMKVGFRKDYSLDISDWQKCLG